MTARERVRRTLTFQGPDRPPRELWCLPGVMEKRQDEVDAMLAQYPSDFKGPPARYGEATRERGTREHIGTFFDEWGCGWTAAEDGVAGEVKVCPLEDWSSLATFTPPWEILDGADLSKVNAFCAESKHFAKAGTGVRPFERMQFLRGSENLFLDLAWLPKEVYELRDMVHEFSVKEMKMWAETDVEAVSFMDDWGSQFSLLIDPALWRSFYKPLYKEYCDILKATGKFVFFHSDGHIEAILGDLIEIGVDAVNCQLFCMDIEEIARKYKGKITFWGEICRQNILPFGTVEDVRNAVHRVRAALDDGTGGVIAQCEWGKQDPQENVEAVFETWAEDFEYAK